jgi:hypothetical protein
MNAVAHRQVLNSNTRLVRARICVMACSSMAIITTLSALQLLPEVVRGHAGNKTGLGGLDGRRSLLAVDGRELAKHAAGGDVAEQHHLSADRIHDHLHLPLDEKEDVAV